jgi:hypothetical protein
MQKVDSSLNKILSVLSETLHSSWQFYCKSAAEGDVIEPSIIYSRNRETPLS